MGGYRRALSKWAVSWAAKIRAVALHTGLIARLGQNAHRLSQGGVGVPGEARFDGTAGTSGSTQRADWVAPARTQRPPRLGADLQRSYGARRPSMVLVAFGPLEAVESAISVSGAPWSFAYASRRSALHGVCSAGGERHSNPAVFLTPVWNRWRRSPTRRPYWCGRAPVRRALMALRSAGGQRRRTTR